MNRLVLERYCYAEWGTYGYIVIGGRRMHTAERPWLDNARRISCVPEGTYKLVLDVFKGRYEAPLLLGVPGRDQIQMHVGNVPFDTDGCIVVGWEHGFVKGEWSVYPSQEAFDFLMGLWRRDPFHELQIVNRCHRDRGH